MSYLRLILIILLVLISGCIGKTESQNETVIEKVELEFYSPKVETEFIFNELIEEFEELHPTIDVRQVVIPDGMEVLKTRIARGDMPDIFFTYPIEQDYVVRAKKGYLLDLTNEMFIHDINPNIQRRYGVDGKFYGVALTQNAVGVLYNKDHFKELNLQVPHTWDAFIACMKELDEAGKTAVLMANKEADQTSIFNLNLVANNFTPSYWENETYEFSNDEDWITIAEKMLTVLSYAQTNSFEDDFNDVYRKFANGNGSLHIMGTWALPEIENLNPYLDYGIFPFPATNKPEKNKVLGGVDIGLAIASDTEYPEEAKLFLEFLIQEKNANRISTYEGSISTVKNVGVNRETIRPLSDKIQAGKSSNWPNHYWAGGTAAESDFRNYSLQFLYDQNIELYLTNLENMFKRYSSNQN